MNNHRKLSLAKLCPDGTMYGLSIIAENVKMKASGKHGVTEDGLTEGASARKRGQNLQDWRDNKKKLKQKLHADKALKSGDKSKQVLATEDILMERDDSRRPSSLLRM